MKIKRNDLFPPEVAQSVQQKILDWKRVQREHEETNPHWLDAQEDMGRSSPAKLVNIQNKVVEKMPKSQSWTTLCAMRR